MDEIQDQSHLLKSLELLKQCTDDRTKDLKWKLIDCESRNYALNQTVSTLSEQIYKLNREINKI